MLAGSRRRRTFSASSSDIVFYRDVLGLPLMFESNGMAFFDVTGVTLARTSRLERQALSKNHRVFFVDRPHHSG